MRLHGRMLWLGLGLVAMSQRGWAQADVPAAAQKAFADGSQFEQRKQLSSALDSFHSALKLSGGHCVACLDALARVQLNMELYKDSAASAAELAAQSTDSKARAQAQMRGGLALFEEYFAESDGRGDVDKNPKKAAASLKASEAMLAQGEADDPTDERLRMMHGRVLAALKRDEDASREFTACAAAPGASPEECARAQHFARDVSIARNEPAPAFELKTIDGQKVSLDSLAGKVVLVDFWATWCSVCERDSDYVQSMVDDFDKDHFVLLEISGDKDASLWANFVKDKRLEGVQTNDSNGDVSGLFHVSGFPTYVILDGNGVMRLRAVGIEGDLKGTVRKLIAEQTDAPTPGRVALPRSSGQ